MSESIAATGAAPFVQPYLLPGGAMTNLSPADYAAFLARGSAQANEAARIGEAVGPGSGVVGGAPVAPAPVQQAAPAPISVSGASLLGATLPPQEGAPAPTAAPDGASISGASLLGATMPVAELPLGATGKSYSPEEAAALSPAKPVVEPKFYTPEEAAKLTGFKEPKEGQRSGYLANIGAGTGEGAIGMISWPVDVSAQLLKMGAKGIEHLTGADLPDMGVPVGSSEWWDKVFSYTGTNPSRVVPATTGENLARGAVRAITSVVLPGGIAKMIPPAVGRAALGPTSEAVAANTPVPGAAGPAAFMGRAPVAGTAAPGAMIPNGAQAMHPVQAMLASGASPGMAAMAGVGGAAGQAAADLAPPEYKGVVDVGTQMATAGLLGAGTVAARGVGRMAGDIGNTARGIVQPGVGEPIVNPATGMPFMAPGLPAGAEAPVLGTPRQMAQAGRTIAGKAGMEPGALAAQIPTTPEPIVPGSHGTLGQTTGNLRILSLERQLRNVDPGRSQFIAEEAKNNLARVAHLSNATRADATTAARDWFMAKLAQMNIDEEAAAAAGHERVVHATEGAGIRPSMPGREELGAGQHAALEDIRKPIKNTIGKGLDAIDPDGTLAVQSKGIAEAAKNIQESEIVPSTRLHPSEQPIIDYAKTFHGVEAFSKIRLLMRDVSFAMREIRKDFGAESPPARRMQILMDSIQESIAEAAGRVAGAEAEAGVPAGQRIIDRLMEADAHEQQLGGVGGTVAEHAAAGAEAGAVGGGGAAAAGAEPPGPARGTPRPGGVSPAPAVGAGRKPESLVDFLISKGGMMPTTDSEAIGLHDIHYRQGGRLINKNGMTPDYAREAAEEAGFIRSKDQQTTGINDLYNALAEERAGNPVYRPEDVALAAQWKAESRAGQQRAMDLDLQYGERVRDAAENLGVRLSPEEERHAVEIFADNPHLHEEDAVMQAVRANEDAILQQHAERSGMGRPGVNVGAQQAELGLPAKSLLEENMTPEKRAALSHWNQLYAEYKARFREGTIGKILASGIREGFKMPEVKVPAQLWRGGSEGVVAANDLIKATGSVEAASRVLGDAPALSLRDYAFKDGVPDTKAIARWMNDHKDVLSKFPDIAVKFRNLEETNKTVIDAAVRGQERIKAFQDGAAKMYIGKGVEGVDTQVAIEKMMNSENPAAAVRDLMKSASENNAAVDGIRRNVMEWLMNKAQSTAEAGTTKTQEIAGASFQKMVQNAKVQRALQAAFTPEQMRVVTAVSADLLQAARAWGAVRVPGSPGSAADMHALLSGSPPSVIAQMWLAQRAATLGARAVGLSGPWGAAVGAAAIVGRYWAQSRLLAGAATVADLTTAGVLNPQLGRVLLQAAVENPQAPLVRGIGKRIVTLGAGAIAGGQSQERYNRQETAR